MKRLITMITIVASMSITFAGDVFATDKLPVFVSIVPQKYFVQQIGKDLVDIQSWSSPVPVPLPMSPNPNR